MTSLIVPALTAGSANGPLALLTMPLSLWGGLDVASGRISDVTHPQYGRRLAGHVLAMKAARGSSSSSSALVEAVRCGTAPLAIILGQLDPILIIGSLVAADLYRTEVPILLMPEAQWPLLIAGGRIIIVGQGAQASMRIERNETAA